MPQRRTSAHCARSGRRRISSFRPEAARRGVAIARTGRTVKGKESSGSLAWAPVMSTRARFIAASTPLLPVRQHKVCPWGAGGIQGEHGSAQWIRRTPPPADAPRTRPTGGNAPAGPGATFNAFTPCLHGKVPNTSLTCFDDVQRRVRRYVVAANSGSDRLARRLGLAPLRIDRRARAPPRPAPPRPAPQTGGSRSQGHACRRCAGSHPREETT